MLVVGDVMLDVYRMGRVDRISPEAPVPVVSLVDVEARLGGAANVALNIKTLGGEPVLCTVTGDDEAGRRLRALLAEAGIDGRRVIANAGRKTTVKTRILASGQQLLRLDEEDTADVTEDDSAQMRHYIAGLCGRQEVDAIVLQDYDKGVLTPALIAHIREVARQHDIPVVVDPKQRNFWHYRGVSLFKPNLKELAYGLNRDVPVTQSALDDAADEVKHRLGCRYVVVTLSSKGIYVKDRLGEPGQLRDTGARAVADVSGAGDTVISVLALGMASEIPLQAAVDLANRAAGIVCGKLGVAPVYAEELRGADASSDE